jgi:hypothetical protein
MHTSQSRLVREAVVRELDAGRYVHIRPRRLPPECLNRVEALADKHGIDRDFARRLAAELHRYGGGRVMQILGVHIETIYNLRRYTYAQIDRACAIAQRLGRGKLVLVQPPKR